MKNTISITEKRRERQRAYNEEHGITPQTVSREISLLVEPEEESIIEEVAKPELFVAEEEHHYMTPDEVRKKIAELEKEMKLAAKEMRYEDAAHFRDLMRYYQKIELTLC